MDKESPVIVRKGIDRETAERFKTAIEQTGVRCAIREMEKDRQENESEKETREAEPDTGTQPMIKCPKCGFEQPESAECVQCGIVIEKYKKKRQDEADLKTIINEGLHKYKDRLNKQFHFSPDIPGRLLIPVLEGYADNNIHIEPSDVLLLVDHTLLAKDASSNSIFTSTSMISRNGMHIEQIEYFRMKTVADTGLLISRILQLDTSLVSRSGILTSVKNPQIIVSMLKDLHRAAKRADDAGILPKGTTEQGFAKKSTEISRSS